MNIVLKGLSTLCLLVPSIAYSALSLDRTRIIFDGEHNSISLKVYNSSGRIPFLAQSWLENNLGKKSDAPFVATPPIQRIEPNQQSQIKIELLKNNTLPQDRESVYYFNFRQIPPKSDKPNVLQLTVQTKIKLFYRPQSLVVDGATISNTPWQRNLVLDLSNNNVVAQNPTPYYITVANISKAEKDQNIDGFEAFMVAPFSSQEINIKAGLLGKNPYVSYIDDYGSNKKMRFSCSLQKCIIDQ